MESIYIAGPLFNSADRSYLEHIAGVINELTHAERSRIFYGDLRAGSI
jgi:hypothetical protein